MLKVIKVSIEKHQVGLKAGREKYTSCFSVIKVSESKKAY